MVPADLSDQDEAETEPGLEEPVLRPILKKGETQGVGSAHGQGEQLKRVSFADQEQPAGLHQQGSQEVPNDYKGKGPERTKGESSGAGHQRGESSGSGHYRGESSGAGQQVPYSPQVTRGYRSDLDKALSREDVPYKSINALFGLEEDEELSEEDREIHRVAEAVAVAWCLALGSRERIPIPKTAQEALSGPHRAFWKEAMMKELSAMEAFGVWDPEPVSLPLPAGKHAVDTRWVFDLKRDAAGRITRFRARLVVRGFTQLWGIDFDETHSNVAHWGTLRVLFELAAVHGWCLKVADVNNAFLNAPLAKEVYVILPPGVGGYPAGTVLRLRKAMYGLKQAPRT